MKKYFIIGICFMLSMIPVTVQARPHHGGRHHGGGELNGDFYKAAAWTSFGISTVLALKTIFSPTVVTPVVTTPVVATPTVSVYPAPYPATTVTDFVNPVVPVYNIPSPPPRHHYHHRHHRHHRRPDGGRHHRR